MIEAWVPITIAAAFLQNLRSAMQKALKSELSNNGATYVRFFYGVPFAALVLGILMFADESTTLPKPRQDFFLFGTAGGLAQIFGTAALLKAVTLRSFAVGTAYSKTEPLQAAFFGFVLLGEGITAPGLAGLFISGVGVIALSVPTEKLSAKKFLDFGPAAWLGLASGALFAIAAVCYRGASLSLPQEFGVFVRALFTLVAVILFQTLVMTGYLIVREPGELARVGRAWRPGLLVGASGAFASMGWFTAMTLENAAHVRAVGQLELVFALLSSWLFFREKIRATELAGISAILLGILILIGNR